MILNNQKHIESTLFLKKVINSVFVPMFIKNEQHQWVFVNKAFCELIGLKEEYILGKSDYDFFRKEEAIIFQEQDHWVFQTETPTTNEECLTKTNGENRVFEIKRSIIDDLSGNKLLLGVMKDVTDAKKYQKEIENLVVEKNKEEKNAQKRLEESEALFRSIFENAYEGINYTLRDENTKEFIHHHINQKGLEIYDISLEEYFEFYEKRQQFVILQAPEFQANGKKTQEYFLELRKKLLTNSKIEYEWLLKNSKNELKYLYYTVFFVKISEDKTGIISLFKDITDQKEKEAIIQRQLKDLSIKNKELKRYIESNMQLESFAYMASHDLRSPLQTMIGFTKLLEESLKGKMSEEEKDFFEFINTSIQNMQALIKDLLAYSIVDAEKQQSEKIELRTLLKTVQLELGKVVNETQAKIELQKIPEFIYADKIKLKQLFQNLITNGIKFTKSNVIPKINISCIELDYYWQFALSDNGIGIAEEFQKKIFLIFRRLHPRDEYEGTGIGLALCKKLVEQHQGKIWLESTVGQGSTFYFTIKKKMEEVF